MYVNVSKYNMCVYIHIHVDMGTGGYPGKLVASKFQSTIRCCVHDAFLLAGFFFRPFHDPLFPGPVCRLLCIAATVNTAEF